jgi:hypothetical protein
LKCCHPIDFAVKPGMSRMTGTNQTLVLIRLKSNERFNSAIKPAKLPSSLSR